MHKIIPFFLCFALWVPPAFAQQGLAQEESVQISQNQVKSDIQQALEVFSLLHFAWDDYNNEFLRNGVPADDKAVELALRFQQLQHSTQEAQLYWREAKAQMGDMESAELRQAVRLLDNDDAQLNLLQKRFYDIFNMTQADDFNLHQMFLENAEILTLIALENEAMRFRLKLSETAPYTPKFYYLQSMVESNTVKLGIILYLTNFDTYRPTLQQVDEDSLKDSLILLMRQAQKRHHIAIRKMGRQINLDHNVLLRAEPRAAKLSRAEPRAPANPSRAEPRAPALPTAQKIELEQAIIRNEYELIAIFNSYIQTCQHMKTQGAVSTNLDQILLSLDEELIPLIKRREELMAQYLN